MSEPLQFTLSALEELPAVVESFGEALQQSSTQQKLVLITVKDTVTTQAIDQIVELFERKAESVNVNTLMVLAGKEGTFVTDSKLMNLAQTLDTTTTTTTVKADPTAAGIT